MKATYYFVVFIVFLTLFFILEAFFYIDMEREKKQLYTLREEVIELKMQNRKYLIQYQKMTDISVLSKWAKRHGFTKKWVRGEE